MTPILEARAVSCGYGNHAVVRDLDLHVERGEIVALLGANGAGKTTTLRTLSGELPAQGGTVLFGGVAVTAPLHRRVRSGFSIVPEERNVVMTMTVRENLRVSRCEADKALALFPELADHLGRTVGLLSGGQQQMLALAIALARPTSLLLADELSLGLAPQLVDRLLETIRGCAREGVGVVLVEQHVHKAMAIADRAYVMQRGRVELVGATADLRSRLADIQASYISA